MRKKEKKEKKSSTLENKKKLLRFRLRIQSLQREQSIDELSMLVLSSAEKLGLP